MKSTLGLLLVFFISVNLFPAEVRANYNQKTSVNAKDTYFLQVINQLLLEVLRLQNLLNEQKSVSEDRVPYPSVLFTRPMEAKYFTQDNRLTSVSGGVVREIDQELFRFFSDVLGKEAVAKYVAEWRVFYEEDANIDAFVESTENPNRFVVSVNRFGFDQTKNESRQSYAELFIHEYAHLLFLEQTDLVKNYTEMFWTPADINHANRLKNLHGEEAGYKLMSYYENNQDRFVSDYATFSPDEDMAETFVTLVYGDLPTGQTIRDLKILALYGNPTLRLVYNRVRENLAKLEVR